MGQIQVGQVVEVIKILHGSPEETKGQQGVVDHIIIEADGTRSIIVLFPSGASHYYDSGELMIIQVYPLSSPFSDDK